MSGSVNKVILVGNLGSDPEVRTLPSGGKVVNLSVATSGSWRDRETGERKEKTEWHRVVIFSEGLAKVAEQYLRKGSKVYLEGQLQTRKWQDHSGQDKYSTEIVLQGFNSALVMLDGPQGKSAGATSATDGYAAQGGQPRQSYSSAKPSMSGNRGVPPSFDGGDDDIPFEMQWR